MSDPVPLGKAISELVTLRGLARRDSSNQLREIWKELAGEQIAERTIVLGVKRRALRIGVRTSPLLNELVAFHKDRLLAALKSAHPELNLKDIKFELRGQ